jgi:hypothetical protein
LNPHADGNNWLHFLAAHGDTRILAEWMARMPEAIDAQNIFGQTPAHVACGFGNLSAAVLLKRIGARMDIRDCLGRTPIDLIATGLRQKLQLENPHESCAAAAAIAASAVDAAPRRELLQSSPGKALPDKLSQSMQRRQAI